MKTNDAGLFTVVTFAAAIALLPMAYEMGREQQLKVDVPVLTSARATIDDASSTLTSCVASLKRANDNTERALKASKILINALHP